MPAIVTPLMEDIRAKRAARNAPRSIVRGPPLPSHNQTHSPATKLTLHIAASA
jgi:hypothetical protein